MKRRGFGRRGFSRRKRRVVWFVPRGNSNGTVGASESCFADQPFELGSVGDPSFPNILESPIVWNLSQSLPPDVGGFGVLKAHPISEKWRIERIVGQIQLSAFDHQQVPIHYYGLSISMGIVHTTALGDAIVDPSPLLNDSANNHWMWRKFSDLCNPITLCATCQTDMPCGLSGDNTCITHNVAMPTTLTPSQVFGLPTAKWIPVDVRPRRNVGPEESVSLIVQMTKANPQLSDATVFVTPKLRVLLSRTI